MLKLYREIITISETDLTWRSLFFKSKMIGKIQPDKWRHFVVGIAMGLLFEGVMLWYAFTSVLISTIVVFFLVVVISYGFELTSLVLKRGHYDVMDAIAGIAGGVVGIAVILLLF